MHCSPPLPPGRFLYILFQTITFKAAINCKSKPKTSKSSVKNHTLLEVGFFFKGVRGDHQISGVKSVLSSVFSGFDRTEYLMVGGGYSGVTV